MPKSAKSTAPGLNTGLDVAIGDIDLSDLDIALAEVEAEEIAERLSADGVEEISVDVAPPAAGAEPTPPVAQTGEPAADDLGALVAELQLDEAKAEVYAEAEATAEREGSLPPAASTVASAETKAPRAPRAVKSLSDLPDSAFFLLKGDDRDPAEIRRETMARMPQAKKVQEKFENALAQLSAGKTPSVYVTYGWQLLRANGGMTSAELVACFTARGYKLGTARAQAQQVMTLLPALLMVKQDGKKLVINPDSRLAEIMNGLTASGDAGT